MSKPKDDAYFKTVQLIADMLVKEEADDADHGEADSKIGALAREYGLSYSAVLKNVLERVRLILSTAKRAKPKLKH